MPQLRQTYLGASTHQTLCIVPYSHQRPLVPTGGCYISRIPDELLYRTLGYLAPEQTPNSGFKYEPCLPLSLVCRRWERLYCAFFYRNIDLGYFGWQKPRRIMRLEATLRQRPDLCDAVRMVGFRHDNPGDATCQMIAKIIIYSQGLRSFELHTWFHRSAWIILDAAKTAPLATLKFSGSHCGPSLPMIVKHFSLPTLKEVSFNGYGPGRADNPSGYISFDPADEDDLGLLLSSTSPCNVTTIELIDPTAPARVTKTFLQWPARLTSLTLRLCDGRYNVDAVQGILYDHHHTLQHISLAQLVRRVERMPDFSSFTSLESLQIHGHNLFAESPCRAAAKLDAPRLCHLRISFDTEDQDQTDYTEFEDDKIAWLEDFFDQTTPTTNRLETVFIEFDPDVSIMDFDWFYYRNWPWSYIDQAVGMFASQNITMTYTQPRYSKKEWDRAVDRQNEEDARQARLRRG